MLFEEPIKIEIEGQSEFCKNICSNKNIPVYTAKDCTSGDCHVISCQCFKNGYNKTAVILVLLSVYFWNAAFIWERDVQNRKEKIFTHWSNEKIKNSLCEFVLD